MTRTLMPTIRIALALTCLPAQARASELAALRAMSDGGPAAQAAAFTGERPAQPSALHGANAAGERLTGPLRAFKAGASRAGISRLEPGLALGPNSRGLPRPGSPAGVLVGLGLAVGAAALLSALFPAGIPGGVVLGIVLGAVALALAVDAFHKRLPGQANFGRPYDRY